MTSGMEIEAKPFFSEKLSNEEVKKGIVFFINEFNIKFEI